jgi:hypothetical protein
LLDEDLPRHCPGVWVDGVDCSCVGGHDQLTGLQKDMLELESQRFQHAGSKANEIYKLMGPGWQNRYYQLLHHLIRRRVALEYAPSTVKRLHRLQGTSKWRRTV